jgi:hypothetical protein
MLDNYLDLIYLHYTYAIPPYCQKSDNVTLLELHYLDLSTSLQSPLLGT